MAISSVLGSSALAPAGLGFRNKIINGAMVINQRAATVTASGSQQWVTDRWSVYNATGTVTFQQSSTAPVGFTNSLLATVTATGSYSTSGYTLLGQFIEGLNTADLAWGTSSAKPVTVSFWVRSSVTGTYTMCLQNSAQNRSYVATYTINAANTWEQKFITIQGETSGTWVTDTNIGLRVWFPLGVGSAWDTTGNAWQSANYYGVSTSVDFAANSGATFYVTGVQVEQNLVPTPFEQRPVSIEVQLCQRYFVRFAGDAAEYKPVGTAGIVTSTSGIGRITVYLPVPMRTNIATGNLAFASNACVGYDGAGLSFLTAATSYSTNQVLSLDCSFSSAAFTVPRPAVLLTQPAILTGLNVSTEF